MSGVIDWQPATSAANATAIPKRTLMRASLGVIASVVGQVGRTRSFLAAIRSLMTDQRYTDLNKTAYANHAGKFKRGLPANYVVFRAVSRGRATVVPYRYNA
jgi:hypothetical protein